MPWFDVRSASNASTRRPAAPPALRSARHAEIRLRRAESGAIRAIPRPPAGRICMSRMNATPVTASPSGPCISCKRPPPPAPIRRLKRAPALESGSHLRRRQILREGSLRNVAFMHLPQAGPRPVAQAQLTPRLVDPAAPAGGDSGTNWGVTRTVPFECDHTGRTTVGRGADAAARTRGTSAEG